MSTRRILALHALVAALLGLLILLAPWAPLQRFWLDQQLRWAAPPPQPHPGVVVFDIDEASLAALQKEFGPWPLGRDVYALAVDALREAGARAVVLNLMLPDSRPGDALLAKVLHGQGAPVVLAAAGVPAVNPLSAAAQAPPAHQMWAQMTEPAASLSDGKPLRLGVVTTPLDGDGVLRSWALLHATPNGRLPLLPLATLQALGETPLLQADAQGRVLPVLDPGLATQPFHQLVQAAREGDGNSGALRAVRGKVVFIGAGATLGERVMTPWGQRHATVLLAQAYEALRDGHGLQALSPIGHIGLLVLALAPALWALLRGGFDMRWHLRATGLVAGLLLLAMGVAYGLKLWVDPSPAWAALLLGVLLHGVWQGRVMRQKSERLRVERQLAEHTAEAKARFLSNVSQELRTPLSVVVGAAELLEQDAASDAQRRQLRLLGQASRNLQRLIEELLDYSRLDMRRLSLEAKATHLPSLLRELVASHQSQIRPGALRCELLAAADLPPWVLVDAQRLRQVLGTLLGNAIQFSQQGRVSLDVQTLPDGQVQFAVSDTGIGIAGSQLQRIFEPFAQGSGQELRLGGTGLGLAVARELVRLMGGDIQVQSVPGAGSRFSFALHLPPAQEVRQTLSMSMPDRPLPQGLALLLAEGDELNAELRMAQLEPLGFQIERAANGHLALALAQKLPFDLILIDLQLPGLDGLRVVRGIREHEREQGLARTPILTVSNHITGIDLPAGLEAAGCDEQLIKPLSKPRLLQALRRWAPEQPRNWAASPLPAALASDSAAVPSAALARKAHAAVFLGRWGEAWAGVRTETARSRVLLSDLMDCARGIEDGELLQVAGALDALLALPVMPLRQQVQAEEAVQREVAATLLRLRG